MLVKADTDEISTDVSKHGQSSLHLEFEAAYNRFLVLSLSLEYRVKRHFFKSCVALLVNEGDTGGALNEA